MIRIDIVKKAYGNKVVLRDVHLQLDAGETVAILGPSGAGKSTLLRIAAGIDERFEGRIVRPKRLAMVFQEPVLLPWRSVLKNLTLVHSDLRRDEAIAMLARTGIADKADLFPGQLSLGQQRRLALARAFAGRPELLIMDEPYVSLDPETADDMISLTEKLIRDSRPAVLLVTHARREAERLAGRSFVLKDTTLLPDHRPVDPELKRRMR
ncbi:ABC transporter ATP-binding protein [Rhizobium halophytocola]|uniref:NitT/TauT family transport system ATP-binding protein n=1 Tax=Rhizobium halophytocola TaxID=735519 RepID=A0ABS4DT12_9HYPH|nr:ATP-binding cassette domain-containing protein [Rhizobium halophytocola]MBP1848815.1 NitT/TauT family transport system ATP-binding protein [Rhizobium halophytocola]